jgi:hypothetical protein
MPSWPVRVLPASYDLSVEQAQEKELSSLQYTKVFDHGLIKNFTASTPVDNFGAVPGWTAIYEGHPACENNIPEVPTAQFTYPNE